MLFVNTRRLFHVSYYNDVYKYSVSNSMYNFIIYMFMLTSLIVCCSSVREPDLPDRILPDVPPIFSVVDKGTQRSNIKLISSDGYEYTKKVNLRNFCIRII